MRRDGWRMRWGGRYGNQSRPRSSPLAGPARRGRGPEELVVRQAVQLPGQSIVARLKPVDLLEQAARIGIEGLASALRWSECVRLVAFPRPAVCLDGHVRQRVEPVLRMELDAVDGNILGPGSMRVKRARSIDIAVGRRVQARGVRLHRVGRELLHVHDGRCRQALRPERVEPARAAVGGAPDLQTPGGPRLVARDERLGVEDRGRGPGKDRDAGAISALSDRHGRAACAPAVSSSTYRPPAFRSVT